MTESNQEGKKNTSSVPLNIDPGTEPGQLTLILDHLPIMVALIRPDERYVRVNQSYADWFGLPKSAFTNQSMSQIMNPITYEMARQQLQTALSGRSVTYENLAVGPDGMLHTISVTLVPNTQPDGTVRYVLSVVQNVSERKRIEEALLKSEQHLRMVLVNSPVVIFSTDNVGIFTLSEGQSLNRLGLRPGEVVGRSVFEIYRNIPEIVNSIHRALAGETLHFTTEVHGVNFETWCSPLLDGDGAIQGMLGVSIDVTERVKAEKNLRDSEERYRSLVENQGEGVIIVDEEGKITLVNTAGEGIVGSAPGSLVGQNLFDFVEERLKEILRHQLTDLARGASTSFEISIHRVDGQTRQLLVTATPRFDKSGIFCGGMAIFRDITDRKLIEEKLRFQSTHDALTGVYNRYYFEEEIDRLEHSRREKASLIMADIDGLKQVNDTWGHASGDVLLRKVAKILLRSFRAEDLVARIGGDEFAVILNETDPQDLRVAMKRLKRNLTAANKEAEIPIRISVGAVTIEAEQSLRRALHTADQHMYHHKQRKRPKQTG